MNREKILKWVKATTFALRQGLCKERGSVSWESNESPGKFIVAQKDGTLNLQKVEAGCQSWNACFIATKSADNDKAILFQPIESQGSFLSWTEDNKLSISLDSENTAWDIHEKDAL